MSWWNQSLITAGLIVVLIGVGLWLSRQAERAYRRGDVPAFTMCVGLWLLTLACIGLVGPGWLR